MGIVAKDQDVYQSLARLTKPVVQYLENNLHEDEEVDAVIPGSGGQSIIATNKRVFVLKPNIMSVITNDVAPRFWLYQDLSDIEVHKGTITGFVVIHEATNNNPLPKSAKDARKAINSVPITDITSWGDVRKAAEKIRLRIHAFRYKYVPKARVIKEEPVADINKEDSVANSLEKIANLYGQGLLSEEDFQAAKKKILDQ